jgi:molecular chaperone GrpE
MPEHKKQAKKPSKEQEKIAELTETLQRVQAEFENYKKRIEKENLEFKQFAAKEVIGRLLPILDNFELALKNKKDNEQFLKGMELIYSQFFSTLENLGLKKIDCNGKFDPHLHEALMSEKSEKEPGTIIEEFQKGYILNNKVVRHSKVKVAK